MAQQVRKNEDEMPDMGKEKDRGGESSSPGRKHFISRKTWTDRHI